MLTRDPKDLPTEAYRDVPLREQRMADAMAEQVNDSPYNQVRIFNNMTTGYRDLKDQYILFVNHAPRSLGPSPYAGISVKWSESQGQHQITNKLATDPKKKSPESLQIKSQHPLCLPCRNLLNTFCQNDDPTEEELHAGANVVTWHTCISSIVISVNCYGCFICKIILHTYLWPKYPSLLKNASGLANFRIEVCWDPGTEAKKPKKLYFAAINTMKPRHTSTNYFIFGSMCAWPQDLAAQFSKVPAPLEGKSDGDGQSEEAIRKQLALSWVNSCISNLSGGHGACAAGDDNDFTPSRLLHVENALRSGNATLTPQHNTLTRKLSTITTWVPRPSPPFKERI